MRILITGVTGFVGSRLFRVLRARGDAVAGTFAGERPEVSGAELYDADLLEPRALRRAVDSWDPEAIIHLAGLSRVGESWDRMADYFRVNVLGTENLLAAATGRRLVVASSAEVYGCVADDEQPLREDRPVAPRSPYALTKAAVERLAARERAVVVRSFNLLGPGQSVDFALPSFAAQLAEIAAGSRDPVLSVGNLEARRDFVHVDDGVEAYRLLAEAGAPGGVYNLGSGEAHSIREVLDELLAISGVEVRVETDPMRLRPADLPLLRADISRLRALGWSPARGWRKALEELWAEARTPFS